MSLKTAAELAMKLYLIRHPMPKDAEGLCYGRLDVAVDPALLAATLAKVRKFIPAAVLQRAPIFTSPLSRCAQFANAIAEPRTAEVAEELIELDFGSWEGKPWNEVSREELDNWSRDLWMYRPGGGENTKTLADRWQRWHDRVSLSDHDAVIAVTHAGVIRVALARAGRLALDDMVRSSMEFGSVHCVDEANSVCGSNPEMRVKA
jgi:alpha-ribazole phosphatase